MEDAPRVRAALETDRPSVLRLLLQEGLEAQFLAREFLVLEHEGRIVGCARTKRLPEGGSELGSVVVEPGLRGRGFARPLVVQALAGAPEPVFALTLVPELAARAGFRPVDAKELPESLRAKAAACATQLRPWRPMRLSVRPLR